MSKRTTQAPDDDVASSLQENARRRGSPIRQVVNDGLRGRLHQFPRRSMRLRVKARDLELRDGLAPDDVERLLETVCGPVDS